MKCKRKKHGMKTYLGLAVIGGILLTMVGCKSSPEKRANWVVGIIEDELELNEAQKTKLLAIKDKALDMRKDHVEKKKDLFAQAEKLLLSDKVAEAEARDLMNQKRAHMDDGFKELFPLVQEFHASLTPEQKQSAVDTLKEFKKRTCHR